MLSSIIISPCKNEHTDDNNYNATIRNDAHLTKNIVFNTDVGTALGVYNKDNNL